MLRKKALLSNIIKNKRAHKKDASLYLKTCTINGHNTDNTTNGGLNSISIVHLKTLNILSFTQEAHS